MNFWAEYNRESIIKLHKIKAFIRCFKYDITNYI